MYPIHMFKASKEPSQQTNIQRVVQSRSLDHLHNYHAGQDNVPSHPIQRTLACACGGGCPRCKINKALQTKLKIGAPNDRYELEADRVAEMVMRMPEPGIQRKPT